MCIIFAFQKLFRDLLCENTSPTWVFSQDFITLVQYQDKNCIVFQGNVVFFCVCVYVSVLWKSFLNFCVQ